METLDLFGPLTSVRTGSLVKQSIINDVKMTAEKPLRDASNGITKIATKQ